MKEIYIGRLRRREPAPRDDEPDAQHQSRVVARCAVARVHLVPARTAEHFRVAHLRRHSRRGHQGCRRELAARLVAGRHARRVHVDAGRQLGDLRRQPRRIERAADHQPTRRSTRRRPGRRPARRSRSRRTDRVRRRSTWWRPTGSGPCSASRPSRTRTGRPGRPRRTTKSPSRRATAPASTSRSSTWRRAHVKQLTFGEGSNESPSFAPNGRHIAFMSTRAGKAQIFTITRDGRNLKQVTRTGNNYQPDWSR